MPSMLGGGARRLFGAWEPLSVPLPARLATPGRALAGYYSVRQGEAAGWGVCGGREACGGVWREGGG